MLSSSLETEVDTKTVIKVENVGKEYQLGEITKDSIKDSIRNVFVGSKKEKETFWALKNVSFEVKEGEVLGIVGKNGAGKSTLLKVLSRITYPTEGSITMDGRVASLLEVGTGFHPELTGRENVFLNGSILGMNRREIKDKFDEIVAFSGVEKFIDTPVKRYSSGMYVRLAFSVAAHLEPEILIIDEVLAVGDADFQKKCLGKMKDVAGQGRTVLFVSHNMAAVKSLCTKAIVLQQGKVAFEGETNEAIHFYMQGDSGTIHRKQFNEGYDNDVFQLKEIFIGNSGRLNEKIIQEDKKIELHTKFIVKADESCRYHLTYHLNNEMGEPLFSFSSKTELTLEKGDNHLICIIPSSFLQTGQYFLSLFFVVDQKKAVFVEKDVFTFTIVESQREIGKYMGREPGYIRPSFKWEKLNGK